MLPIATSDFSATLIKAKAYKPNVLLNNMGGSAQINCMKQFVQFGMAKEMALGGALFEIEVGALGAEGGADRLVGHGMVVGPAERAAGEEVRRRDLAGDRQQEADGAPLDGLCLAARRAAGGGEGQVARRGEDGACARGSGASARGVAVARTRSAIARAIIS